MSMTDPIADMLTRIRNAMTANHADVHIPGSKVKRRIAQILAEEGYISEFDVVPDGIREKIRIRLKWLGGNQPAIEGLKRVSRPGQRQYARCDSIPKVRNGLGIMIVSTSRGVMTDRKARREGVGGELICSIW